MSAYVSGWRTRAVFTATDHSAEERLVLVTKAGRWHVCEQEQCILNSQKFQISFWVPVERRKIGLGLTLRVLHNSLVLLHSCDQPVVGGRSRADNERLLAVVQC